MRVFIFIAGFGSQFVDVIMKNEWAILIRFVWGGELVFATIDRPTFKKWTRGY